MAKQNKPDPDFESALTELEKLVENLEKGDLTLDQSLADFKHGIELTRQCQSVLDDAQQTVDRLINPDDEESLEPFEPDA